MQKPCLLKHEASFGLHTELFKGFLTYKSDKKISSYLEYLTPETKNLIITDSTQTFRETAENIKARGQISNRAEYLTLALREMIVQNQKEL